MKKIGNNRNEQDRCCFSGYFHSFIVAECVQNNHFLLSWILCVCFGFFHQFTSQIPLLFHLIYSRRASLSSLFLRNALITFTQFHIHTSKWVFLTLALSAYRSSGNIRGCEVKPMSEYQKLQFLKQC